MTTRKDAKLTDSRVMERYLRDGGISQEQYDAHMKNLPDDTNNAQWVQLDLHDAELGDSSGSGEGSHSTDGDEEAS
jgi:hypothetical protein